MWQYSFICHMQDAMHNAMQVADQALFTLQATSAGAPRHLRELVKATEFVCAHTGIHRKGNNNSMRSSWFVTQPRAKWGPRKKGARALSCCLDRARPRGVHSAAIAAQSVSRPWAGSDAGQRRHHGQPASAAAMMTAASATAQAVASPPALPPLPALLTALLISWCVGVGRRACGECQQAGSRWRAPARAARMHAAASVSRRQAAARR